MITTARPDNPYATQWDQFRTATAGHELTVIRDDGLSRHLRVQTPRTRIWSWDVITWPGHLAICGDVADGYMFTRESDMLRFFSVAARAQHYFNDDAPCIDVSYWAEKLCGSSHQTVQVYDSRSFMAQVRQALAENLAVDVEDGVQAIANARYAADSEETARTWLADHEDLVGNDTWEWDLRSYTTDFLIACYALDLTARLYGVHQADSRTEIPS